MNRTRILTSVSVAALMTTTVVTVARADNAIFDLTKSPPTLTNLTKSASVIADTQLDLATKLTADVSGGLLGIPDAKSGPVDLLAGKSDSLLVDKNTIFSDAVSNTATNSIDLFTATGSGTTSAATIGELQGTSSAGTAGLSGTIETSAIRINAQDIGAGGAATMTDNQIAASATGNTASSEISGNINPLLSSTEVGQSKAQSASPTLDADATVLVATVQALSDIDAPLAGVSGSRIGLQATSDGVSTKVLDSVPLTMTGNAIDATMLGNDATGIVFIENDKALTLDGSAGVSTLQYADGKDALTSKIDTSRIEVGDSGVTPTADLLGSDVTFSSNAINADATANSAANTVMLAESIQVAGISTQANTTTGSTASAVGADLFIHNTQTSLVSTSSSNQSDLSVLVQDVTSSTVLVGDADITDKTDTGNQIEASATGSDAANLIQTGGGASFSGLAAINTTQVTAALNDASVTGTLTVSAGTLDPTGATDITGTVGRSAITVDGNSFTSTGTGNRQDSLLAITATTVAGDGTLGAPSIVVDRSSPHDGIESDFSLLNAQVLDGANAGIASATATTTAQVTVSAVNLAGAGTVAASQIDVSGNSQTAKAIGNLSTEDGIDVTAGSTFTGTIGVINDQTVENGAAIAATNVANVNPNYAVAVAPASITDSALTVDGNQVTAIAYGNLSNDVGTSFAVSGVTVGDGDAASALLPTATVDRKTDTVPISTVDGSFALLNDQSAEDLSTVTASLAHGSFEYYLLVDIGDATGTTTFNNNKVDISGNAALAQVTVNQATSEGTVTATTLNGSSVLVNTQTLADEDKDGSSVAGVDAALGGGYMRTEFFTNGPISASDIAMNDNAFAARAAVNVADNTLKITAQTQVITGVVKGGAENSVNLDTSTAAAGENMLVNDQYFDAPDNDGFHASLASNVVDLFFEGDAANFSGDSITADGNSQLAYAAGNDAANTLTLDVGSFDLSAANTKGGALNGPVATLTSNQRSADGTPDPSKSLTASEDTVGTTVAVFPTTGTVSNSHFSVDGNSSTSFARVNNVSNMLTATGTSFVAPTTAAPTATLLGKGGDVVLDQTGFVVASRQENAYGVSSTLIEGAATLGVGQAASVTGSTLTVDDNLLDAEGYGNNSENGLTLDFGVNQAQGFVANQQSSTAADPTVTVSNRGGGMSVGGGSTLGTTSTSISLSGNKVLAVAGTNQTDNTLTSTGADITGGSGAAPTVALKSTGEMDVAADLGIVNAQGGTTTADTATDAISVTPTTMLLNAGARPFNTGSLTVDNNLMQAQGIIHSASNDLEVDASAAVGSLGAIVASQQVVTAGSTVSVTGGTKNGYGAAIHAFLDLSDAGAVSVDMSENRFTQLAMGGTATNTLGVTAGSSITGTVAAPAPSIGATSLALNADFDIANEQLGKAATISTSRINDSIYVFNNTGFDGDAVTVDNNLIQSQSVGFGAANVLTLDAGSSSDATASVANHQLIDGTAISSSAAGSRIAVYTPASQASAADVSNNAVLAGTFGNSALNGLVTSAKATLQQSDGVGSTIDPAGTSVISVSGADYSVLNWQETTTGTSLTSSIDTVAVGFDGFSGATGVNTSSLSVHGNVVEAQATANDATNVLVLNSGTFQQPSAAIANLQTTTGTTVSASVTGVSIGIGLTSTIDASGSNSSLSVTGNVIGASVTGNSAVNVIRSK